MVRQYIVDAMIEWDITYQSMAIPPLIRSQAFYRLMDTYRVATDIEREEYIKRGTTNE